MRPTRKIKIRKLRQWAGGLRGRCHANGFIEIDPRQDEQDFLDTLLHELLHRELPDLDEQAVIRVAERLAWEMWKLDYRRVRA